MLQIIPINDSQDYESVSLFKYKCGEIFCNDIAELVIRCSVCQTKSFRRLDEFLEHIRTLHSQIDGHFKSQSNTIDDIESVSYRSTVEEVDLNPAVRNHLQDYAEQLPPIKAELELDDDEEPTTHNNNIIIEEFIWKEVPYLVTNITAECFSDERLQFLENEPLISLNYRDECRRITRSSKNLSEVENLTGKWSEEANLPNKRRNVTSKSNNNDTIAKIPKKTTFKYKCTFCDQQYKSNSQLKMHLLRQHPAIIQSDEEEFSGPMIEEVGKVEKYSENNNGKVEKNANGKDVTKTILEWCCIECSATFESKKLHYRHCVEEHSGFKCPLCDKRFRQLYQCKRHEQTHATEKTLICTVEGCGKGFTDQYYLKRHLDVHKTDRSFFCDFEDCKKSFYTHRRLLAHKKLHTKPKNLICDMCGYCCREKETLRVHQRTHTGERPYPCTVCEKRFASSSSLAEHMASHTSVRPHVCNVCQATFARQKALYHHSFLHLEFKKFKCKICGRAYRQAAGLSGHLRKHREENALLQPLAADLARNAHAQYQRHKMPKSADLLDESG